MCGSSFNCLVCDTVGRSSCIIMLVCLCVYLSFWLIRIIPIIQLRVLAAALIEHLNCVREKVCASCCVNTLTCLCWHIFVQVLWQIRALVHMHVLDTWKRPCSNFTYGSTSLYRSAGSRYVTDLLQVEGSCLKAGSTCNLTVSSSWFQVCVCTRACAPVPG